MEISKKIVLLFPRELVEQAVIYRLVKEYDLKFNILRATVTPQVEGVLVMELVGEEENYERGIAFMEGLGLRIQSLSQDIQRNDDLCIQCGVCTAVCPSGALAVGRPSMEILFDNSKCVVCEQCIKVCTRRAMELHY